MANVRNWQLNRDMKYEYIASPPDKQVAAVFDINKCIACQTCTMACKTTWTSGKGQEHMFWNNVETKPWGSYPMAWDVEILDRQGAQTWDKTTTPPTFSGETIFEKAPDGERVLGWRPEEADWANPNRGEDETNEGITDALHHLGMPQQIWNFYMARICNHCSYPACLAACPRKAIYKRKEDGIVLIDQERCRGYRECVKACPYKKSMYNLVTRVSEKCIFCYPAIEQGIMPRCMRNCIGKIRMVGFINKPADSDPTNPIDFLVHEKKVAVPLFPQFGLEPNVYYIPPMHLDNQFVTQLFGPSAPAAVTAYKDMRAGNDPDLRAVLLLMVSTEKILTRFERVGNEAVGYDVNDVEAVRVPFEEPTMVRPFDDTARGVFRLNIT